MTAELLHVASRRVWEDQAQGTSYVPATFAEEGFVHLCTPAQLPGVLDRYYRGATDLVLLRLDAARLPEVRWERGAGGDPGPFPHAYGPIPTAAVLAAEPKRGPDHRR